MAKNAPFFIISVVLIVTIVRVSSFSIQTNDVDSVCSTVGCIESAKSVIDRMDPSIDPCDDFYNFACGNFNKYVTIPDNKSKVDVFSTINDKVKQQLRACFSEKINPNDPAPFNAAKKIYNICMHETATEKRGKEPLLNILKRLGGWPVVEGNQWNENGTWTWTDAIGKFRKIGFETNYLVSAVVSADLKNSTSKKLHVRRLHLITSIFFSFIIFFYFFIFLKEKYFYF